MITSCGLEGKGRNGSFHLRIKCRVRNMQVKLLSLDNASYTRFFLNIARWEFDYFGSNKYLYYILSIK